MKQTWKFSQLRDVDAVVGSAPSLTAAARALGVDRSTVHRWLIEGKVRPPARAGRRRLSSAAGHGPVADRLQGLLGRFEAALERLERAVPPGPGEAA